jgi:hypothetical protein
VVVKEMMVLVDKKVCTVVDFNIPSPEGPQKKIVSKMFLKEKSTLMVTFQKTKARLTGGEPSTGEATARGRGTP